MSTARPRSAASPPRILRFSQRSFRGSSTRFLTRQALKTLRFLLFYVIISLMLTKAQKQRVIKGSAAHDKDTGSAEVQISVLTKRIDELARHLKKHQKDVHSRRGLLQMVAKRQIHLRYLRKHYPRRYDTIVKKLELKK